MMNKNNQIMYSVMPWIASIAFFMQTLDASILITSLPKMADSLNESPLNLETAVICYSLTLAIFIPVSGFVSDRFGTRNIFIFSLGIFSLGSFCSAVSVSLFWLDVSRVIQGIGGAMMVPVSRLVLLKIFDKKQLLTALNRAGLLGLIGPFIGPVLGGYLTDNLSWHWIFLINIPFGILGIMLSLKFMPNIKNDTASNDYAGLVMVSLSFIFITLSLEVIDENNNWLFSFLLFFAGIFSIVMYVIYAKKNSHCENDKSIFKLLLFTIRTFRLGLLGNSLGRMGSQAITFLIPLFLQLVFGYSALSAGLTLTPVALSAIFVKGIIPSVLGRYGYKMCLMFSTVIVGIAIGCLSLVTTHTPVYLIVMTLLLIGGFNSLRFTALSSITLADLPPEQSSSGNSLLSTSQQLAITFGVSLASVLIRLLESNETLVDAFKISFFVFGVITILSSGVFMQLRLKDGSN
ncbi:MFS transporter, partial [Salmonella enterica subsp. enterica serovar Infantis]|nr:MFS transporter [Salmonella enterica subsp. enterica serovar Infantis]